MDRVWDLFRAIPRAMQADSACSSQFLCDDFSLPPPKKAKLAAPSSSTSAQEHVRPLRLQQINDHVYELLNPLGERPSLELIFFHGLQLEESQEPHLTTWLSRDGSEIWLDWILKEFPDARILTVSYDAHMKRTNEHGLYDMYVTTENLLQCLIEAKPVGAQVGQNGCPVVLVGHCLGGLVMKQLCVYTNSKLDQGLEGLNKPTQNFLRNIRGLFFYASPHHGTRLADMKTPYMKGQLFENLTTLNTQTSRQNMDFRILCQKHGWKTFGIGESLAVSLGRFNGLLVPEASARHDVDKFYTSSVDHFNICRHESISSSGFSLLSSFIVGVVKEVPSHECQGLPDYSIDLDSRAWDVEEKLSAGAVVGIFGMGGIGKTTIAKKVFNNISKNFEYTCFVENVKGIKTHKLEDWLLKHFHQAENKLDRAATQWSQLKDKKALIVMDDIDSEDQLKVLPRLQHFQDGSCFIMTSRDKEIFKFYDDCVDYEVDFLQEDDARNLLCHHAFGLEHVPNQLEKHVSAMVKKCAGLPLTLEVMGRYLRGRASNVKVWEETMRKLGRADSVSGRRNDNVWASLKISYDALSKEERETFISAALVFFEEPLDVALAAWSSPNKNTETTWTNLVSKSMVKAVVKVKQFHLDGWIEFKEVWVHEHMRDLAKKMTNHDLVSESDDNANLLVDQLNAKKVNAKTQSLQLFYSPHLHVEYKTKLCLDSLAGLKRLKYIKMNGVLLESRGKRLKTKLSVLRWKNGRDLSDLEVILNKMDDLAVLELSHSQISKKFSEALGNLTNLQILSLRNLEGLDQLRENFGNLSRLRRLELEELKSVTLPESFGNLLALEDLTFGLIDSVRLPESIGDLSSLATLRIYRAENLVGLPDSFGRRLMSLKVLNIFDCHSIKCLPYCFSELPRLQQLAIVRCSHFEELGDAFGSLSSLQKLVLGDVPIRRLPTSFGGLLALEELTLNAPSLKRLPDGFGQLTALKDLIIFSHELHTLPNSFCFLESVRQVDLCCAKLKSLPENLGLVASLKQLRLCDCESLTSLPDSLGKPSSPKLKLSQGHDSHELMQQAEESSQTMAMEVVQLFVRGCRYVNYSDWTLMSTDALGYRFYQRKQPAKVGEKSTQNSHIAISTVGCKKRYRDSTNVFDTKKTVTLLQALANVIFETKKTATLQQILANASNEDTTEVKEKLSRPEKVITSQNNAEWVFEKKRSKGARGHELADRLVSAHAAIGCVVVNVKRKRKRPSRKPPTIIMDTSPEEFRASVRELTGMKVPIPLVFRSYKIVSRRETNEPS